MPVTSKALVEFILLGPADDRRQLQDSPILGDVWAAFADNPGGDQDLLITPYKTQAAGPLAAEIARRVAGLGFRRGDRRDARVAYLQGITAAHLHFAELLRIVVPMTWWWNDGKRVAAIKRHREDTGPLIRSIDAALTWARDPEGARTDEKVREDIARLADLSGLDRYLVLAGIILAVSRLERDAMSGIGDAIGTLTADAVAGALFELDGDIKGDEERRAERPATRPGRIRRGGAGPGGPLVWQVSLNRTAAPALERSVPAVKADAARTLFSVNCGDIAWAVVDSGIDAGHPVFRTADGRQSRVVETYDFTRIRDIVSLDNLDAEKARLHARELLKDGGVSQSRATALLRRLAQDADNDRPIFWELVEPFIRIPRTKDNAAGADPGLDDQAHPRNRTYSGHGTHVGAIIGAGTAYVQALAEADSIRRSSKASRAGSIVAQASPTPSDFRNGLCPDIRLYDFRVLARALKDTEFAVIAALQYIRYLNERHNFISVHGVNLSLSIPHDVRNFACGRTPICEECARLVSSGVVVVAAAGNRGYNRFETKDGSYEGYTAFSITDPGNADEVITVGATHRFWPHTYGVSFFSSRGPTGDGRLKPDLVAPGERIESALPKGEWGQLDGTSMAAPHVSGAAAMLMARYSELVGQPRRIKRILCESATDLGRERTFQGHGMLDVLRAFQSI